MRLTKSRKLSFIDDRRVAALFANEILNQLLLGTTLHVPVFGTRETPIFRATSEYAIVASARGQGLPIKKGEKFMHVDRLLWGFFVGLLLVSPAPAQVTIDAAKITCDQFVHGKVGEPRVVAAWLSGFYNGKRDNRVIDTQNFQARLNELEKFCYDEKNFKLPVMQAIEQAQAK